MRVKNKVVKILFGILIGLASLPVFVFVLFILALWVCENYFPEQLGTYNLGKNICFFNWSSNINENAILYVTSYSGKNFKTGREILPHPSANEESSVRAPQGVLLVAADNDWILAVVGHDFESQRKYYVINKKFELSNLRSADADSIIFYNYTSEFEDTLSFSKYCREKGITINFSNDPWKPNVNLKEQSND